MPEENLRIWNQLRTPPDWALRRIEAGRLKGKSDINPQWRMEAMTNLFGPVGVGWKYTIEDLWLEPVNEGQVMAFAKVNLYYQSGSLWSEPIPGVGGNMMIEQERAGLHANDECYKMAVTDALSTAMKALGVAADVYAGQMDGSKYSRQPRPPASGQQAPEGNHTPANGTETVVVNWGRKGSKSEQYKGMTLDQVWDTGPDGHSYLHWIAEQSQMNANIKRAARATIDRKKAAEAAPAPAADVPDFATADEMAAFRTYYESLGLDLAVLGETIRKIHDENGGVPKKWLDHQRERLTEKYGPPLAEVEAAGAVGGIKTPMLGED